ncbi:protease complex subunit PrcB family protein [Proteiniborus sp.]|uniref:protease complex subunit PrcB family protein n=1 Tax=Proteiniborus sp. TaxID=2079015 RepID=UPI00332461C7
MKKHKLISLLLVMILSLSLFTACSKENTSTVIGDIDFEVVGSDALINNKLEEWYNENYKAEGISSIDFEGHKYILVSAGEMPTGGYSVEITSVVGKEDSILVNAKVNAPKPDEMVTEVLTYPNALIRISKDSRKVDFGEFQKVNVVENDLKEVVEETGVFVGLADSNSCEIIVDGEATPYRLSEEVKEIVGSLEMDQEVKFSYYLNEYEQMVIVDIEKIEN